MCQSPSCPLHTYASVSEQQTRACGSVLVAEGGAAMAEPEVPGRELLHLCLPPNPAPPSLPASEHRSLIPACLRTPLPYPCLSPNPAPPSLPVSKPCSRLPQCFGRGLFACNPRPLPAPSGASSANALRLRSLLAPSPVKGYGNLLLVLGTEHSEHDNRGDSEVGHGGSGWDSKAPVWPNGEGRDVRVTGVRTICVTAQPGHKGNDTGFIMCQEPRPLRHYCGVTFDQDQREA